MRGDQEEAHDTRGDPCSRFHSRANRTIDSFYNRLGFWVASHTKTTLLATLLVVVACCSGFANFSIETDEVELWAPADSPSKAHRGIVDSYFNGSSEYGTLLFVATSDAINLLTKESFDRVWEIDAEIRAFETENGNSYEDICKVNLDRVTCSESSRAVTRFWSGNYSIYQATVADDADILAFVNEAEFPDGGKVIPEMLFGNSITYNGGAIVAAEVMSQTYLIRSADEGEAQEEALDWQAKFQDLIAQRAVSYPDFFTVYYLTGRSLSDALEESVSGEIFLFVITYCVMITFVTLVIGRCCDAAVGGRSWVALGGVTLVLAAGLAAYGINSAFGVPFTVLAQILPFILIGIGVDDMFVIIFAFDNTDPELEVKERVALALERCGISITYTSLTNFLAFMLGSLTTLPAVKYFCLYAATSILVDFVLQVTAFVALVTIQAERQKKASSANAMKRWFCCRMNTILADKIHDATQGDAIVAENKTEDLNLKSANKGAHKLGILGRWMRNTYAPLLLTGPGKVFVLGATAGLLAAGIYGTTQVTQGFDVLDLAPDDHFAREYNNAAREYELEIDSQFVSVKVYTLDVDYTDVDVQAQIQATDALMIEQEFASGPTTSWLTAFIMWANTTKYSANVNVSSDGFPVYTHRDTFYEALTNFTQNGTNIKHADEMMFGEDNMIEISFTTSFLINQTNAQNHIDALLDARDVVGASSLDPQPFAFTRVFLLTEQFLVIFDELIMNFILALAAVTILSMVVLGRLVVVLLVSVTVVMIDIELLGFVHHWGLEVNSITVIELIMAVGLVVDYVIHVVHYALNQKTKEPKDKRIAHALGEIGPSVTLGATTTFLGIVPMAFATNVIFRVFFRMFLIIVIFGFVHGIVFIPVALSLLPTKLVKSNPVGDSEIAPSYSTTRSARIGLAANTQERARPVAPKSIAPSSHFDDSPRSPRGDRESEPYHGSADSKQAYP